ncbi:hypothetical protein KM043_017048 [Ampulex compressa]|nr:hypothetical protein KM043_017048 [Ampulex compressa]
MGIIGIPCTYEFSRGNGTGVAEAIGNWGFSNKMCSSGQELRRLKCLIKKMDCLRTSKPMMRVEYNRQYDLESWHVTPSPAKCKPAWAFPLKRPLITYSSTSDSIATSNLNNIGSDLVHVIPGRSYVLRGTDKWYRCT